MFLRSFCEDVSIACVRNKVQCIRNNMIKYLLLNEQKNQQHISKNFIKNNMIIWNSVQSLLRSDLFKLFSELKWISFKSSLEMKFELIPAKNAHCIHTQNIMIILKNNTISTGRKTSFKARSLKYFMYDAVACKILYRIWLKFKEKKTFSL